MNQPDRIHLSYDYTMVSTNVNNIYPHSYIATRLITLRSINLMEKISQIDLDQLDTFQKNKLDEIFELAEQLDE